jgi:gas vesicle protein
MRKVMFGILVGAAAAYLLDPEHGAERRARLMSGWQEQKDTVLEAARSTAGAVSTVGQEVGGRVSEFRARTEAGNGKAVDAALETAGS